MKPGTRHRKVPPIRRWTALAFTSVGLLVSWQAAAVGSWIPLDTKMPGTNAGHMLLLSDATVMVQQGVSSNWWRLTPGSSGGYTNGTWAPLSPMSTSRKFYSSDVLPDGRVFVAGGEHNNLILTNIGEIYNPLNDSWTPTKSAGDVDFSDSGSVVLRDGNVLVHPIGRGSYNPNVTLIYNPTLDTWAHNPPSSLADLSETSWVKLPDDSILTVNDSSRTSERYIPSLNQWIKDANVPVNIYSNNESGAAFLLPDTRAFFLGASGHTALYTPSGTTNLGAWVAGPDIPEGHFADDSPAAMMANGRILCIVGTNAPNGGSTNSLFFYEYDYSIGATGAFQPTSSPRDPMVGSSLKADSYDLSLLDLPDGTVLFSKGNGTPDPAGLLYVYQPDTPPLASGKPTVDSVTWNKDGSLHLTGKLFNGISEGSAFGDDAQEASNYPIVRLTDGASKVTYGRTYNWSSTGVMTDSKIVTTEAKVDAAVANSTGNYSLQVIANGIASDAVTVYGDFVWVDFNYGGSPQNGTYANPYSKLLAQGIPAVSSGGTIAFKANVQPSVSPETMTISKPMTLISVGGPATIGQ
jgi:hypothetical protein